MITPAEVGDLLRLLAHIDARTIDKDDIALWLAALQRDRVTFVEARDAVMEQVTAAPGDRVNIGHVISRVRARRRILRQSAGTGIALQQALRAVPADAPDYNARVLALLREPSPGPVTASDRVAITTAAEAAAERSRRGADACRAAIRGPAWRTREREAAVVESTAAEGTSRGHEHDPTETTAPAHERSATR